MKNFILTEFNTSALEEINLDLSINPCPPKNSTQPWSTRFKIFTPYLIIGVRAKVEIKGSSHIEPKK